LNGNDKDVKRDTLAARMLTILLTPAEKIQKERIACPMRHDVVLVFAIRSDDKQDSAIDLPRFGWKHNCFVVLTPYQQYESTSRIVMGTITPFNAND